MSHLANIEHPDEMLLYSSEFALFAEKKSLRIEAHLYLEILTCDPLICTC